VLVLVGAAVGFGWGIADRPTYRATATVVVESDSQGADAARLERFAQRGESEAVARRAAAILGRDVPGADLLADVTVEPAVEGGYLVVGAESQAPDVAAAAADGFARALVAVEGEPLALGAAATIPAAPVSDRPAGAWAGFGALAGLIAGLIALAATRRRRRDGRAVAVPSPAPATPWLPPGREDRFVELGPPLLASGDRARPAIAPAAVADAGMLADRLGVRSGPESRTLAVVPVGAAGPAAELAVVLAIAASGAGRRALVVESNLASPALAGRLDAAAAPGLSEYLLGHAAPREVLRAITAEPAGFACVPAGEHPSADGVSGPRFADLAARLARAYDLVVHLAPPVRDGNGGDAVAALVDEVVVVAGPESDPAAVDRVIAALADAPLLVHLRGLR
jgi:hypothetical protein